MTLTVTKPASYLEVWDAILVLLSVLPSEFLSRYSVEPRKLTELSVPWPRLELRSSQYTPKALQLEKVVQKNGQNQLLLPTAAHIMRAGSSSTFSRE